MLLLRLANVLLTEVYEEGADPSALVSYICEAIWADGSQICGVRVIPQKIREVRRG